jgi:hypothetical protein
MYGGAAHACVAHGDYTWTPKRKKCYFPCGRCCSMAIKRYEGFEVAALLSHEQTTPGLKKEKNKRCFPCDRLMVVQVSKL